MRISVRRGVAGFVVAAAFALAACGGPPASAPPSPAAATPTPTPDPHLAAPATADQVYRALGAAGLPIVANNAITGGPNGEPVKRINATYIGWPLNVAQYSSASALAKVSGWKDGEKPTRGEEPITIIGMNILVTWGPTTGATPPTPDVLKMRGLDRLVAVLDGLLSPLRARTVIPVSFPHASPAPSVPSPVPSPVRSAKPTAKPSAKASPKH